MDAYLGRKLIQDVEKLTEKYKQPTAEDITEMVGKRVTEEILGKTQIKMLDFDHIQF